MFSLISCKKEEDKNAVTKESNEALKETTLELQSFKDFPEEIDGAGCYFSGDKEGFKKEKYICVDNLDSICFIKVRGNFIRLVLAKREVDSSFTHYSERFKNEEFELSIDIKATGDDDDETSIFEGSMSIKHNDEPAEKRTLYGECGC
jgi:hypothetical protein